MNPSKDYARYGVRHETNKHLIGLGFREVRPGIYTHPDHPKEFDFTVTHEDMIFYAMILILRAEGYEKCQKNIRKALGI